MMARRDRERWSEQAAREAAKEATIAHRSQQWRELGDRERISRIVHTSLVPWCDIPCPHDRTAPRNPADGGRSGFRCLDCGAEVQS